MLTAMDRLKAIVKEEKRDLEGQLDILNAFVARLNGNYRPRISANGNGNTKRAKSIVTPKQLKARQLAGRWMGTLRTLNETQKRHVQAYRREHGMAEAIKEARRINA